ncbi:hypothetical protein CS0771_45340 [Catellatospora sp. IY07-71]|uniref:hypothetical protein n=1 Tax=Catellatospora sp. IY07-71 TaxID=2728827 RepID=UPI001BB44342|nr:hypothetical protein [Catellatospora sp. IY07-71]BCJ74990.1 hypothetical protein CS0771_45340 [Catellatospora sp. IY07-71]
MSYIDRFDEAIGSAPAAGFTIDHIIAQQRLAAGRRRVVAGGLAAVAVLAISAAAFGVARFGGGPASPAVPGATAASGWRELPGSPLSPRVQALGLWTGDEALIIGGSDAPCPPSADCAGDPDPLTSAAAVNPDTGRWRSIADLPVALRWAQGAVVGGVAYVQGHTIDGGFALLAYVIDADRWEQVPLPAGEADLQLVAAGDLLVAVRGSHENTPGPDYIYDRAQRRWQQLPVAPLGAGFDRAMAWTGRELVLFDHELVPDPGARRPAVTRAAVFDPATGEWRRLPDSQQLSTGPWLAAGGSLVNPSLGGADGGQVGNWGRTYPNGGILDPANGTWSALPDPPGGYEAGGSAYGATSAVYAGQPGPVLNTAVGVWQNVAPLPTGDANEHTVVAAGNRMLVSGGVRWVGTDAELLSGAWIWAPPS